MRGPRGPAGTDFGQHFGGDLLAAGEVAANGAFVNAQSGGGLFGIRGQIVRVSGTAPFGGILDQPLTLKNFLPTSVVIGPLRVGQFGAGPLGGIAGHLYAWPIMLLPAKPEEMSTTRIWVAPAALALAFN